VIFIITVVESNKICGYVKTLHCMTKCYRNISCKPFKGYCIY